jgi:two-component system chemotaxis response regulator CheY
MMLNGIKILIGDDSILARKQLKDIVSNGQDAIDLYKKESPELVFLDIVMPVKDGISAITEIKAYDKDADIIVVSSVGTQTQLKAAIEAGANDFIQKPLNAEQIHHIISSRFEGR